MKQLPLFRRPFFARKILEVGCGHAPYRGITHAVDKFPHDNTQRATDLFVPAGVEFRQGDLESIPFDSSDKFDFFYASHVLEHVFNPEKAVREINRVAKCGYIETPSPLREQIWSTHEVSHAEFHTLFCWTSEERNTIHVAARTDRTIGSFCKCRNGMLAKDLFLLRKSYGHDIEPLLPRRAKTTQLYFKGILRIRTYNDMTIACESGSCAYASAAMARRWMSPPLIFLFQRFRRLKELIREYEGDEENQKEP